MARATIVRGLRKLKRLLGKHQYAREHSLANYQAEFPETGQLFLEFLRRCRFPQTASTARPIGVVVMPWVGTPTPWYQITLGIGLLLRSRPVVFVWDDTAFPTDSDYLALQNEWIHTCLSYLQTRGLTVLRLSQHAPASDQPGDQEQIEKLAKANLVWASRARQPTESDLRIGRESHACLTRTLPLIRSLLQTLALEALLVPGGVRGTSGLFLLAGREVGLRVATVDSDFGVAQVSTDGVAAQCADIPRAFAQLWDTGGAGRAEAITLARAELQLRLEARDRAGFQTISGDNRPGGESEVLVPLNIEWDTAALGRHEIFTDTSDWITSTVAYLLDHSPFRVAIRVHPAERRPLQHSGFDPQSIVKDALGDHTRVRLIAADDPVNTYDLLRAARLVLPFVSTIGIEAAALGKSVLVSGNSYYAGLGFVWSARSRADYFELLQRGLQGELPPKPDQIEKAWLCFYLTAVSNRLWTEFTPHPTDFWRWCRRQPADLFQDPAVLHILTAIDQNVPLALVRHWWRTGQSEALNPGVYHG